jgi:hypothetical protein
MDVLAFSFMDLGNLPVTTDTITRRKSRAAAEAFCTACCLDITARNLY